MHPSRLLGALAALSALAPAAVARAEDPTPPAPAPAPLAEEVRKLTERQAELEAQVKELRAQSQASEEARAQASEGARPPSVFDNLNLWGYGELYYTHPVKNPSLSQADLYRAVFGIGYRFADWVSYNSEFEVEHTVASATDVGEFEVEQFYLDFVPTSFLTVTAGLFLMPFGFLNEHHEPTNFYGVQRNFVETLIIPSTWREGGVNLHGDTELGIGWSVGLSTGFDLSRWSFSQEFPPYATALNLEASDVAPLQAVHQELALANAQYLSQYGAVNYHGLPGLLLGAAVFTGDAVKVPSPPNAPISGDERVWLWEGHARFTPGRLDLSALYAGGAITNVAAANAANPGSPNPIPSRFYGYFLQAAYTVWQTSLFRLSPFARFETYNMGSLYEGTPGPTLPSGSVPLSAAPGVTGSWPENHDTVWTLGASFYVTPHVVVKADYQLFVVNTGFSRFDLGLGLSY